MAKNTISLRWLKTKLLIWASMFSLVLSGCSTVQYAWQAASGHLNVLQSAKPVDDWLANQAISPHLRDRLRASQAIRSFAVSDLKLPDNQSYRSYADLKRPYAVWNVFVAPSFDFRLVDSCFWLIGCLSYRGFYAEQDAQAYAQDWAVKGFDVSVSGIPAYSTLGYSDDPLLNTFIGYPIGELARLIFHELTHQKIYVPHQTQFNESLATAVEELGLEAWFRALNDYAQQLAEDGQRCDHFPELKVWLGCDADKVRERVTAIVSEYEGFDQRRLAFKHLVLTAKADLVEIYAQSEVSDDERLQLKNKRYQKLLADYEALKKEQWQGWRGYDGFFNEGLNNAKLAALGLYNQSVPSLKAIFEQEQRQFEAFYRRVEREAKQGLWSSSQTEASPRTK